MEFFKNGVSQGTKTLTAEIDGKTWFPFVQDRTGVAGMEYTANFGQSAFTDTPTSGFVALNTANLPAPTITRPQNAFQAVIDTDTLIEAALAAARTGWTDYIDIYKNRDVSTEWYVRFSDDSGNYMSFDGEAVAKTNVSLGALGDAYVGYSIRVGASYGLYTADVSHTTATDTITAHGLTSDGGFMGVVKRSADASSTGGSWYVDHPALSGSYNILFDTNAAEQNATVYSDVDATNITISKDAPTGTYRLIVWAEKHGLISLQGYTGNGSADGPMVYHGGRPLLCVTKRISGSTGQWFAVDRERSPINQIADFLTIDSPDAETTAHASVRSDYLAVGAKIRGNNVQINTASAPYLTLTYLDAAVGGTGIVEGTAV